MFDQLIVGEKGIFLNHSAIITATVHLLTGWRARDGWKRKLFGGFKVSEWL